MIDLGCIVMNVKVIDKDGDKVIYRFLGKYMLKKLDWNNFFYMFVICRSVNWLK